MDIVGPIAAGTHAAFELVIASNGAQRSTYALRSTQSQSPIAEPPPFRKSCARMSCATQAPPSRVARTQRLKRGGRQRRHPRPDAPAPMQLGMDVDYFRFLGKCLGLTMSNVSGSTCKCHLKCLDMSRAGAGKCHFKCHSFYIKTVRTSSRRVDVRRQVHLKISDSGVSGRAKRVV